MSIQQQLQAIQAEADQKAQIEQYKQLLSKLFQTQNVNDLKTFLNQSMYFIISLNDKNILNFSQSILLEKKFTRIPNP
jgi:hypothetical protein